MPKELFEQDTGGIIARLRKGLAKLDKVCDILKYLRVCDEEGTPLQDSYLLFESSGRACKLLISPGSGNPGPWDYTIDNTAGTVTIEGGWVFRGKRDAVECDEAEVTVNSGTLASPCWAYAEYITATGAITIITTCLSTPPKSETGIYRIPLHTFYMSGASIVHHQQQQFGAIKIDGMFA